MVAFLYPWVDLFLQHLVQGLAWLTAAAVVINGWIAVVNLAERLEAWWRVRDQ